MPDEHIQVFVRLRSHTTREWIAPEELRRRLVDDTTSNGSNLTEVVVGILAGRFNVPFEPAGRRTEPDPTGEELNLRLPTALYQRIAGAAARARPRKRSVQREILAALCAHYGLVLPAQPRYKRNRRRRGTAPATT